MIRFLLLAFTNFCLLTKPTAILASEAEHLQYAERVLEGDYQVGRLAKVSSGVTYSKTGMHAPKLKGGLFQARIEDAVRVPFGKRIVVSFAKPVKSGSLFCVVEAGKKTLETRIGKVGGADAYRVSVAGKLVKSLTGGREPKGLACFKAPMSFLSVTITGREKKDTTFQGRNSSGADIVTVFAEITF